MILKIEGREFARKHRGEIQIYFRLHEFSVRTRALNASRNCRWKLFASIAIALQIGPNLAFAESSDDFFEKRIRPVLAEHCWKCHGSEKQSAELRLDGRDSTMKGGENGPVIVSGKPDESLLIKAIRYQGDTKMPPDRQLSEQQIAAVEEWVRLGAPWPASESTGTAERLQRQRSHWAFQPLSVSEPQPVEDLVWNANPIDRFVVQRLSRQGLSHSPAADKRMLIRRVTYDLTGLPPSNEDVEKFVHNSDPDSYSQLVERLLASATYGEHWARHWLDLARYSDTKGYVYAREERFWVHSAPYRDWVVRSFQRDLPYDQFLLLQLAADHIAKDDPETWAAMGFLTLGRRFLGVSHDIIDDRIDVVTRATMGLTVACARCHDHKYDPIPTSDYYSLYGVFLNSREELVRIRESVPKDDASIAFENELTKRQQKLRDELASKRREAAERTRNRISDYLVAQTELSKYPDEGFDQVLVPEDLFPAQVRTWETFLSQPSRDSDPIFSPWRKLAALHPDNFASNAQNVIRELSMATESKPNQRILSALTPAPESMRDVAERYGRLLQSINQEWLAVCDVASKNGAPAPTSLPDADSESIRQVLYGSMSPCAVPDEAIVSIENHFDTNSCTELWRLQGEVDRWLINSPLAPPFVTRLIDQDQTKAAYVFRRGNPRTRGAVVDRHFLSVIAGSNPPPFAIGSGRLELARAIADPKNPLTARVWVNRIWMHHFGAGLVTTPSDFGVRSEPPSHPELLDWLAGQLIQQGWSTKAIHRLIVNSQVYRQTSIEPSDLAARDLALQVDPSNRLLWRMTPRRLSFEEFRDTLLAASGRLDLQQGGRATDLFASYGLNHRRRTLYGLIDRQFFPSALRIFDVANPELHTAMRSETTVPQQALFSMNYPLIADIAKELVVRTVKSHPTATRSEQIREFYRRLFQRDPRTEESVRALAFLDSESVDPVVKQRPESFAWQYGYGEMDETSRALTNFTPLPYFSGTSWQGGAEWPDGVLGWLQLTPQGGHPGDDLKHAVVRRWTAPRAGRFAIRSTAIHEESVGDGVRCQIVAKGRGGVLKSAILHNRSETLDVDEIELQEGNTIDFVVDINQTLNTDQYLWSPVIVAIDADQPQSREQLSVQDVPSKWDANIDFSAPIADQLNRWEQFVHVLLMSNELMFVD